MIGNNVVLQDKTKELGLPEVSVIDYSQDKFTIINDPEAEQCPHCGHRNQIRNNGEKNRNLLDVIARTDIDGKLDGRIVKLDYRPVRFLCLIPHCNKSFSKPVTFVEPNKRHTCRLEIYIFRRCLEEKIDNIEASLHGELSNTAITTIFRDVTRRIDNEAPNVWKEPREMGLFFIEMKSSTVLLAINIDEVCAIDFFNDCSLESIQRLARRFRDPSKIEKIWIDMFDPLADGVKAVFPNAELRVGKLQIKRYLNRLLLESAYDQSVVGRRPQKKVLSKDYRELTKQPRKTLDEFLAQNETVRTVYDLREMVDKASWADILDIIAELGHGQGFHSYTGFALTVDMIKYEEIVKLSLRDYMNTTRGSQMLEDAIKGKEDDVKELLRPTGRCAFDIMRARALYGDISYEDALEMNYRNIASNAGKSQADSEMKMYCRAVMFSRCKMEYPRGKKPIAVGFPIDEVAQRLRKYHK